MAYKLRSQIPGVVNEAVQKSSVFLRLMADEVVNAAKPITPASAVNPRLRNDVLKQVLGLRAIIVWNKVYAQYQEAGMRADGSHKVRNYTTPGTGAHFAERAINEAFKKTPEIARKAGLT